ncbi:MAG: ATP-binding protein [Verrucomicrobiia bacterium]
MPLELFPKEQVVGVFKGFREGGLEFHADLVLPYRNEFQSIPMHGQFLLVQLENPNEAVLGRITAFSSEGKLSSGAGEEFNIRAVREDRPVPEDLREQYLKYRVNIRVLGVLRTDAHGQLTFVPSHRRLPHVGSPVAFPSGDVLRELAGHNVDGAEIGHFALGEYIYGEGSALLSHEDWMQVKAPEVLIKFAIKNLVSRRSFIFARAGFGKSNLNKLLFSALYRETPTVHKADGRQVPVGTVIFDPDGEYFWPDDKGRPGLCDVPHLEDKLVVFTSRPSQSAFYQSFVAGGIRLDIRRLRPGDVVAIALGPDRQDQQNVRKIRGLDQGRWERLVNLIHQHKNQAALETVCELLDLDLKKQEMEALAARANMTAIVSSLHDPASQLMDMLLHALSQGKLCVVDLSQMRGAQAMILAGLILRRIFDRNQEEFTKVNAQTIPTIAVIEEAQSVLVQGTVSADPYIAWVKEGRKYDLGAVLVTQQPGSIPVEILSQGDNWFVFHLLAAADLNSLSKANAHFSTDLLSALLNEPIKGQGVFWSSEGGKPYPVAVRVLLFEKRYTVRDPRHNQPAAATFAASLRSQFQPASVQATPPPATTQPSGAGELPMGDTAEETEEVRGPDVLATVEARATSAVRGSAEVSASLDGEGMPWGKLQRFIYIEANLQSMDEGFNRVAYSMVPKVLNSIYGPQNQGWHSFKRDEKAWVKKGRAPS